MSDEPRRSRKLPDRRNPHRHTAEASPYAYRGGHPLQPSRGYWKANEPVKATQALIRTQQIVGELIAGLNTESKSDLVKRLAGIYAFIYRSLLEASFRKDEGRLAAAIRVLEIERETWRQVCEKLGGSTQTRIDQATFHQPQPKMPSFPFAAVDTLHVEQRGGFSLDA